MRNKTREAIEAAEQALRRALHDLFAEATQERLGESDRIVKAISEIQPASVDLTQQMADDIVRKIHGPLTIAKEFSAWIATQARYSDCLYTFQIGYGSDAGRGELRLKGDGSMWLILYDCLGARLWAGTFVPPDFGASDK